MRLPRLPDPSPRRRRAPAASSLCEILNILEGYDLRGLGFRSAAEVHVLVEAMRHAFLDRNSQLGDPDFVQNPIARLLDKDYAAAIRAAIDPDRATPVGRAPARHAAARGHATRRTTRSWTRPATRSR